MANNVFTTICIVIPLLICGSCNFTTDVVWDVKGNVTSSTIDMHNNENIFIVLDDQLAEFNLKTGVSKSISKMKVPNAVVSCAIDFCYLGGGVNKHGQLFQIDPKDWSFNEILFNELAEIYSVISKEDYFVTGHANGSIILWDAKTRNKLKEFGDKKSEIYSLEFVGNQNRVLSGDSLGNVALWELLEGNKVAMNKLFDGSIFTIKWDKDIGVVVGGSDGNIYILDDKLEMQKKVNISNGDSMLCLNIILKDKNIVFGTAREKYGIVNKDGLLKLKRADGFGHIKYINCISEGNKFVVVGKNGKIATTKDMKLQ